VVDVVADIGKPDARALRDGREVPQHVAELFDDVRSVTDVRGGIPLLLLDDAQQGPDLAEQPKEWEC
jgi:hypothetical protein